jgi:5-methyltetrahydrofolate--homocysteine methyltransferase
MMSEQEILNRLRDSIVNLDIEGIKKTSEDALKAKIPPFDAVMKGMAKGMDIVGQKYENHEYFLAELIMAGEVMKEGMNILEPYFKAGDYKSTGKVVIGTVKGDLHDIGKNIAITLLKAGGFEVIDLGVDVPPEKFLNAIREHSPDIVGMSALLTTTMMEMKTTIQKIKKAGLREKLKIIIGGAPITEKFAKEIDADAAAGNAVEGANLCKEWLS